MSFLPEFDVEKLAPTRDYLRNAALVLGSLQRAFIAPNPRDWHHGLEVNMRGLSSQSFEVNGVETRGLIDLVKHKFRLGTANWRLEEFDGPELFNNVKVWLASQQLEIELETPEFVKAHTYDAVVANDYAEALWWLDKQFREIKTKLEPGVCSPVLVYPHHFDLSLVWFPWDDQRQASLGWSTGDETVAEPYLYVTAYPEPEGFSTAALVEGAFWQQDGFSGAVLPYAALAAADDGEGLLDAFYAPLFDRAKQSL